jgi:hypothetical protein
VGPQADLVEHHRRHPDGVRALRAHTKAQHHKAEYALRAAAVVRAGVDPGLLDEVSWWRTDDLWFWALEALVTYVRAAAEHGGETVPAICRRIASRHDVQLAATT